MYKNNGPYLGVNLLFGDEKEEAMSRMDCMNVVDALVIRDSGPNSHIMKQDRI